MIPSRLRLFPPGLSKELRKENPCVVQRLPLVMTKDCFEKFNISMGGSRKACLVSLCFKLESVILSSHLKEDIRVGSEGTLVRATGTVVGAGARAWREKQDPGCSGEGALSTLEWYLLSFKRMGLFQRVA